MKNFLLVLSLILLIQPVMAKNVKVQAVDDFSTVNPPKVWKVKVLETFTADNGITIHANTIVEGDVVNVKAPQRLKRNATFRFVPKTYYDPQVGVCKPVKREFEGKYSSTSNLDKKDLAKTGAISAGSMLIGSFVAPTVGLVEGVVANKEGNRAKSAVVGAYERTPLSYANKGKEMEFKSGQIFVMSFKLKEDESENLPNYTYEMVK
ncbi:MAG: hypothetical protein E7Z92_03460 [Cyanobacteria bacterium SIG31]|nr:hypothetical protein [Cyanobacteria bacterium SIG31]